MRYFSMFTGVGGFELGLSGNRSSRQQDRGGDESIFPRGKISTNKEFRCVGFSEIDKYANQLLAKKFPEVKNYGDATKIIPEELPDFELLVGGFPCQAFSIAGKRRGMEDTRGTLFYDIARITKVKRPKYLLLENVKGLLSHDGGRTFATILTTFSELGYTIQWMVLNSKFFGVPQNRERVFIIGSLGGEPVPEILPFRESYEIDNIKGKELSEQTSNTIRTNYSTGYSNETYIEQLNQPKHSNDRIYGEDGLSPALNTAQGGRRQPMIPINTLKSGTEGVVTKDMKIRRLTPIECERLQGFPDNWTEGFSDTQRYKMMGNAVTTNVIEAIMRRFLTSVKGDYTKMKKEKGK